MPIAGPAPISAAISAMPGARSTTTRPSRRVSRAACRPATTGRPARGCSASKATSRRPAPTIHSRPGSSPTRGSAPCAAASATPSTTSCSYGTGGLAFGELRGETFGLSETHTNAGWTVGVGAEFGLAQNWTAKIEYLYVDLANTNFTITGASNGYRFGRAARRRELSLLTTRNFEKKQLSQPPGRFRGRDFFVRCCGNRQRRPSWLGLDPAIHVFVSPCEGKTWMPGSGPGMTRFEVQPLK